MVRSIWKLSKNSQRIENSNKFWVRNITVTENMVGSEIEVYNGKNFKKILLKDSMVGHFIGEFVFTRRLGLLIHDKKK